MRCQDEAESARLLLEARRRRGLSQRQLALRAGTSQDAISRIERGVETPTLERLRDLLLVMGEETLVSSRPLRSPLNADDLAAARALSPRERLLESVSWNLAATRLELAGAVARRSSR